MTSKAKPKTNAQVRRIFGLAKPLADKCGMDVKEYIEDAISSALRIYYPAAPIPSVSQLLFDQANDLIKHLGGDPFTAYGKSIRTINYRKQAAGIKSIETDAQLKLIRELAAQRHMDDSGLDKLATRMRLPWPPNTTEQGNKLTEALKAMIKRDAEKGNVVEGDFARKPSAVSTQQSAEPGFRRVA